MDLGASHCSRSKPSCGQCPVSADCQARLLSRQADFPGKKPKKDKPVKSCFLLLLCCGDELYLERRPGSGIWGGLWCPPQLNDKAQLEAALADLALAREPEMLLPFRHTFSHYHLDIQPVRVELSQPPGQVGEKEAGWFTLHQQHTIGLAAPTEKLLAQLRERG